jgi:hypothetical protein
MAAISDYLESGILNYIFRGISFTPPAKVAVALTRGVPTQGQTGSTILEVLPTGQGGVSSGYSRVVISTSSNASQKWTYSPINHGNESGVVVNTDNVVFPTALTDWGPVSGVVLLDSDIRGSGNVLMYATLEQQRDVYTGDSIKFNANELRTLLQ